MNSTTKKAILALIVLGVFGSWLSACLSQSRPEVAAYFAVDPQSLQKIRETQLRIEKSSIKIDSRYSGGPCQVKLPQAKQVEFVKLWEHYATELRPQIEELQQLTKLPSLVFPFEFEATTLKLVEKYRAVDFFAQDYICYLEKSGRNSEANAFRKKWLELNVASLGSENPENALELFAHALLKLREPKDPQLALNEANVIENLIHYEARSWIESRKSRQSFPQRFIAQALHLRSSEEYLTNQIYDHFKPSLMPGEAKKPLTPETEKDLTILYEKVERGKVELKNLLNKLNRPE